MYFDLSNATTTLATTENFMVDYKGFVDFKTNKGNVNLYVNDDQVVLSNDKKYNLKQPLKLKEIDFTITSDNYQFIFVIKNEIKLEMQKGSSICFKNEFIVANVKGFEIKLKFNKNSLNLIDFKKLDQKQNITLSRLHEETKYTFKSPEIVLKELMNKYTFILDKSVKIDQDICRFEIKNLNVGEVDIRLEKEVELKEIPATNVNPPNQIVIKRNRGFIISIAAVCVIIVICIGIYMVINYSRQINKQ